MKHSTKIILVTLALATATGAAIAARGQGCDQRGGMQGMQGGQMQGMQMNWQQGMRQSARMGAIYELDNLTDTQKEQITALRKTQHDRMFTQRELKMQQRAEMKQKIDAILTEEQRAQLSELRPYR